ncbi:MAG: hypothetical protein GY713_14645 [Actinomycetia bacterium]|nr:hypothetical protein [Actinomycetes bacterium]MCP3912183.1 hypothetical protein [Actinomycetes bacterium]
MRGNEAEDRALEEPCPVCWATVGQPCRPRPDSDVQSRSAGPHRARIHAVHRRIDAFTSLQH